MSEVDVRIARWRAAIEQRQDFSQDEIEELEVHVRDGVDALVQEGWSAAHALDHAVARLGSADQIAFEYRKLRVPLAVRERLLWMLSGYAAIASLLVVARLVATVATGSGLPNWLSARPAIVLVLVHALVVALAFSALRPKSDDSAWVWRRRIRRVADHLFRDGRRWTGAAAVGATLVMLAAAAVAIDYWQWWATFQHGASARSLALTNDWIELFETALAPGVALAVAVRLSRNDAARPQHRRPTGRRPGRSSSASR